MYVQKLNPHPIIKQEDVFYKFNVFTKSQIYSLVKYIKENNKPYYDDGIDPQPNESIINRQVWDMNFDSNPNMQNFQKILGEVTAEANKQFGFDIDYLGNLKYHEYGESNNHLEWHTDIGLGSACNRKLSFSIIVNNDYEGGQLEIMANSHKYKVPNFIGGMAIFPSFMMHRVTKVEKGVRNAIVGMWSGNRPFR
mgnify:CR=1 FL=1|jgi:hypothetical protein